MKSKNPDQIELRTLLRISFRKEKVKNKIKRISQIEK